MGLYKGNFNYGGGWSNAVHFSAYQECEKITERLRSAAQEASERLWASEMLLRNARLAETVDARRAALQALRDWVTINDPRDSKGNPTPNYSFARLANIAN